MTLYLPSALVVGGSSNVDKMSSTYLNLIPSVAMSSMRQREEMRKTHFEIFGMIDCDLSTSRPKSSYSNISVSAHPIGKLKIVPERLRSREDMVKTPF